MFMQISEEERKLIENYRASSTTNQRHIRLLVSVAASANTEKTGGGE